MPFYDSVLQNLSEYQTLSSAVETGHLPVGVSGMAHIVKAHLIHNLCTDQDRRALVIVADEGEALRMQEDLEKMGEQTLVYPARDFTFRNVEGVSREYEHQRLSVLSRMIEGDYRQVVTTVDALCQYTLPPDLLYRRTFTLQPGQTISPDQVVEMLIASGYVRADQVEGPGQFARRGGILDLFTTDLPAPVRMEFWGDEIDSLACFDVLTQRRTDSLKAVHVPPAAEVLFGSLEELAGRIEAHCAALRGKSGQEAKANLLADAERLRSGAHISGMDRFLPLMSDTPCTLLDYAEDALIFVSETARVRERARVTAWQLAEDVKLLLEGGVLTPGLSEFSMPYAQLTGEWEQRGAVFLDSFVHGSYDTPIRQTVHFYARQSSPWLGGTQQLAEDLAPLLRQGYACAILAGGERGARLLAEDLRDQDLPADFVLQPERVPAGKVVVTTGSLSAGFDYPDAKFQLLTQAHQGERKRKSKKKKSANAYHSLDELHRGDYVVHATHGIGVFEGIHKIEAGGVTKDYIRIGYAGGDTLYVPVTQLDLVSKYIGAQGEDAKLKLHRLGGSDWQKTKSRVKASVKDMAKQLIRLYAERMHTEGYAFSPDTDLQNDFERRFAYEETDDQLRCVEEIKYDMERPVPMDRLLCGDVGFGKTEVALRAAFKCIAEGKQCAILVPTTILAWQHYQTILQRMEGIPVTVDLLNRFRSAKQQAETIRKLRSGEVDLVVGTHRLLSKDVAFHDLGLVIVDEEQRFGVAQKEKLKEMFQTVDVLTLSATPIPRTLNMAMSGLRDMSVIEEAPQDRHPVQTYVLEYDRGILEDAIRREIRRGGQVYYLHNRVDSIQRVAALWQQRIPEARVGIAHGKMPEEELSDIWRQLIDNEIDLLVCTTIIETGVDVPNCNTLIIEDADRMGLAQLHQIRGRVGRSSRRAYAYLTFRPGKALSETATKRLDAVREFTEFGSGIKIAMRDLEIRGAGNLLGAEQHGQMESVGYDMYLKLLADAVKEEKGEQTAPQAECMVDLQIQAHIPDEYIPQLTQRLGVYRRIADIRSDEDALDVMDELIDRFGEPPASVKGLIDVALLRNMAAELHITEVVQKENSMLLYQNPLDMERVGLLVGALRGRVMVNAGQKPYIAVKMVKKETPAETLRLVLTHMQMPQEASAEGSAQSSAAARETQK